MSPQSTNNAINKTKSQNIHLQFLFSLLKKKEKSMSGFTIVSHNQKEKTKDLSTVNHEHTTHLPS